MDDQATEPSAQHLGRGGAVKRATVLLALLTAMARPAIAQNRPIHLIVPFGPGSGSDVAGIGPQGAAFESDDERRADG